MKAFRSAESLEMDITLSLNEIIALDNGDALEGEIKVTQLREGYYIKPLIITRGIIEKDEMIRRTLMPFNCRFENIQQYGITLSDEAIKNLKETGATGQRISEDKIMLYSEKYARN
ncbi:MAG: hypothetical protein AABW88_01995 [Nanoarchaeota archaeon]